VRAALALGLLVALASPTAAQFDLFDWTYVPGAADSTAVLTPFTMSVKGGFADPPGFQGFLATAPVDGRVRITIFSYINHKAICGISYPVFDLDGELTDLALCSASGLELEFFVRAGSEFGFGLKTVGPFSPGDVTYGNFEFIPLRPFAYWTAVGGGVGGFFGEPVLAGQGLLYGGMPVKLELSQALSHAPAILVIGASALNAPFKGGVMVPLPDLLIAGLATSQGGFELVTEWPPGLPSSVLLWMQVWIADPTAPFGLSGTNGLIAATP
jgi:hypothetical protein